MALPGVRTVLRDRFYSLSRTDIPVGTRVVAIARRDNDPDPDAWEAVPGTYAAGEYVEHEGDTYRASQATTDEDVPGTSSKWVLVEIPPNYNVFSPRSERQVIDAFGEDSELHRAYRELASGGAARISLVPLPGDVDDADLIDEVDPAFDSAELVRPDIVVPWGRGWHPGDADGTHTEPLGFYADNASVVGDSMVTAVAEKCRQITDRSNPCFAVLGVKPFPGSEDMSAQQIQDHLDLSDLMDNNSEQNDLGSYVSVLATELRPSGYPSEWGYANGAATYAGFVSSLDAEVSPTGRRFFNVSGLRYEPNRPLQEQLAGRGIVPVAVDFSRVVRTVDGVTFGKETSDYRRLSTLRIVFDAMQLVRTACEPFVGKAATLHHRNSLETAIASKLRGMQVLGALIESDFVVQYQPRENRADVELVLTPAFEMRNIEVSISVQL